MDNLLSAELVTADGRTLCGNFGVVTGFEFRLHEIGPLVYLGMFFWTLENGTEALRIGRAVAASLPRNAGLVMAAGLPAPAAPFVPVAHRGTPGYGLMIAGFGSALEHHRLIAPIRKTLPPLFEFVTPLPYVELQKILDETAPWGIHAYHKGLYLQELSDDAISVLSENIPRKS